MMFFDITIVLVIITTNFILWMLHRYSKHGGLFKIMYFRHKKLFPPGISWENPRDFLSILDNHKIQDISIRQKNGNIKGWDLSKKGATNPKVVFIYCHGAFHTRGSKKRMQFYKNFLNQGYSLIAFDYCGFGDSEGEPSVEGMVQDTLAIFAYAKETFSDDVNIFLYGHSLGGGAALRAAKELEQDKQLKGVIIDGTFYNTREIIDHRVGSWACKVIDFFWKGYIDSQFNNSSALTSLSKHLPILIIHSEGDGMIPFKFGAKLYDESKNKRSCMFLKTDFECGHSLSSKCSHYSTYIEKFVNRNTNSQD